MGHLERLVAAFEERIKVLENTAKLKVSQNENRNIKTEIPELNTTITATEQNENMSKDSLNNQLVSKTIENNPSTSSNNNGSNSSSSSSSKISFDLSSHSPLMGSGREGDSSGVGVQFMEINPLVAKNQYGGDKKSPKEKLDISGNIGRFLG